MEIHEDKEFRDYILDQIRERQFKKREGVHCSDLIYCLNKQAIRRELDNPSADDEVLLFSMGWSTQAWLSGKLEDEPEVEVDGIKVTPDAIYVGCPWELKATYQKSERAIEENVAWVKQVMAQCYVTNTLEARISRFEIMGDWKWIFGKKEEKEDAKRPTLSAWRLKFTQDELDRNWAWLKDRRLLFLNILETKKLLPKALALPSGQEWECKYCKTPEMCEGGKLG